METFSYGMAENLLFGSLQITVAGGQFILQWEQDNEKKCISVINFTYPHVKFILKFKTYGKQNMEESKFCQDDTEVKIKWNRALKEGTFWFQN